MGEHEWEDCLLFITDPATGEQREIGAVKNIEWPEIQKASEESIRELSNTFERLAESIRQTSEVLRNFGLSINFSRNGFRRHTGICPKRNRSKRKQRLTRLQRRQKRQKQ